MDGTSYVQRLVPPEPVRCEIEDSKCERQHLQFRNRESFNAACNALEDEPACLYDHQAFRQSIAFTLVLNFFLGNSREVDFIRISKGFKFFWCDGVRCSVTLVKKHEPAHEGKESVRLCPPTTYIGDK